MLVARISSAEENPQRRTTQMISPSSFMSPLRNHKKKKVTTAFELECVPRIKEVWDQVISKKVNRVKRNEVKNGCRRG